MIHLASLDGPARSATVGELREARDLGCATLAALARELVAMPEGPRIWAVTRGAQSIDGGSGSVASAQAPLWGFGRSLSVECPRIWGGLIDLD